MVCGRTVTGGEGPGKQNDATTSSAVKNCIFYRLYLPEDAGGKLTEIRGKTTRAEWCHPIAGNVQLLEIRKFPRSGW